MNKTFAAVTLLTGVLAALKITGLWSIGWLMVALPSIIIYGFGVLAFAGAILVMIGGWLKVVAVKRKLKSLSKG